MKNNLSKIKIGFSISAFSFLILVAWHFQKENFFQAPLKTSQISTLKKTSSKTATGIRSKAPLKKKSLHSKAMAARFQDAQKKPLIKKKISGAEKLSTTEQASLWKAFSEARREVTPLTPSQEAMEMNHGVRLFANNPRQHLTARFMDDGVKFQSGHPNRKWSGTLSVVEASANVATQEIGYNKTDVEYFRDGLIEYYGNSRKGIEHGFVIEKNRTEESGYLHIQIGLDGLKAETLKEGSSDLQFVTSSGEPVMAYSGLKAWDASGKELPSTMQPTKNGLTISVLAMNASYPITIDPLITSLEQKLGAEVTGIGSNGSFGASVSISGDTALIIHSGSAYVFVRDGTVWTQQQKIVASSGAFGNTVSLSGDTALIGSSSSVYVFARNGTVWTEEQKLAPSDLNFSGNFGAAVSLSGDTALIGSGSDDTTGGTDAGSAYIFIRNETVWTQEQKIIASDGAAYDYFGTSVSLSGDTALIGAWGDSGGSAYVFVRSGTVWTLQQKLVASYVAANDSFGNSVSLSGNTALVGATGDSNYTGSAYVFVRNGTIWTQEQKIITSDGAAYDYFGTSLSLSENTALISASSGSGYVFVRNGTAWTQQQKIIPSVFKKSVSLSGNTALIGGVSIWVRSGTMWAEQKKIEVLDSNNDDKLGSSVSLLGSTALIGVPYDTTVKGVRVGSAYVFVRDNSVWTHQQRLDSSDGKKDDRFGAAVSLSGNTALIGASYHLKETGHRAGAAYVFVRSGNIWTQQQKLIALNGFSSDYFGASVALSEDTALIGAYNNHTAEIYGRGCAYVFSRNGTVWTQQQQLLAADAETNDSFGRSVSLDGDTAIIGASQDSIGGSSFVGSVYVFVKNGTVWSQQQKLIASDGAASDGFGNSVSLSGDTALIAAWGDDIGTDISDTKFDIGSAYIFVRSGTVWTEQQKLSASGSTFADSYFGKSVSLSGDTALIGASDYKGLKNDTGSAYIFLRNGTVWTEQQKLTAPDGATSDYFGFAVSLSGDTALIGAYGDDGLDSEGGVAQDQGSVYVYRILNIGTDSDGDGASDVWESANGFSPSDPNDLKTQDSDGDGYSDFLEIFQGTSKNNRSDFYGVQAPALASDNRNFSMSYRRSTASTRIAATPQWSTDLQNWYVSGIAVDGLKVDLSEVIVAPSTGYDIIKVNALIRNGITDKLFMRLRLFPTQ